mgnify:CR=1 FL=1
MNLKIGVIKGDGIGPEIVTEAMKVLDKLQEYMDTLVIIHSYSWGEHPLMFTECLLQMRQSQRQKHVMQF